MPEKHQLVFYPVGNGDTSQIVLSQGRRVLFDFCHRKKADGADTPEIDLKKRLKEELDAAGHSKEKGKGPQSAFKCSSRSLVD